MKLNDALLKLQTFLSQVQNAKTIADIEKLHPGYEEVNTLPSLFKGKNLNKVNSQLNNINHAIETALVDVINLFLQRLQATNSLDSTPALIMDYHHIYAFSGKFNGIGMDKIEPLRAQMKLTFTQTLLRLTPQDPHEKKEAKEAPKEMPGETPNPKAEAFKKINMARSSELLHVRKMIGMLREKAEALKDKGEDTPASKAANTLCDEITIFAADYEYDMIDLKTFKNRANSAILISHEELDKPRGYCVKHILANLAFAVLTLGIGYLIAAAYKGTFFPISPNTDSANKVDRLELAVDNMFAVN